MKTSPPRVSKAEYARPRAQQRRYAKLHSHSQHLLKSSVAAPEDGRTPNASTLPFGFRPSALIRHSSFVLRHFALATLPLLLCFLAASHCLQAQDYTNLLARYADLKNPKISAQPNQKMIVVEAKGDPSLVGGRAYGLLFQLYYRAPETPKGPNQSAPRARWPQDLQTPKEEWTGLYALPVPDSLQQLPTYQPQEGLKASLTTWEYGQVAEVLHVGPYSRELPTLQRLSEFIKQQGYSILPGGHEEEYLLGPRMNDKGDPEKYLTILSYRVKKN